jgi:hypothetical protein
MPALADQRSADERDPAQPEKQAELAERIGDIDIRIVGDRLAGRAPRDPQPIRSQHLCDHRAAHRMARRDYRQKPMVGLNDVAMRRGGDRLFAGVGAGGKPQGPGADLPPQLGKRGRIGGERLRRGLEIADTRDDGRAEPAKPLRLQFVLGEAQRECPQHRPDHAGQGAPARLRAVRQPGIEKQHRDAAAMGRKNQVRPKFGFNPDRQIGTPMIEKPLDRARQIDRHELMANPVWQSGFQEARRRDSAGGCQNLDPCPLIDDPLHQRQDRSSFADARRMDPDERPGRPPGAGDAEAFAQPLAVFLAAPLTPLQIEQDGGGQSDRYGAV